MTRAMPSIVGCKFDLKGLLSSVSVTRSRSLIFFRHQSSTMQGVSQYALSCFGVTSERSGDSSRSHRHGRPVFVLSSPLHRPDRHRYSWEARSGLFSTDESRIAPPWPPDHCPRDRSAAFRGREQSTVAADASQSSPQTAFATGSRGGLFSALSPATRDKNCAGPVTM